MKKQKKNDVNIIDFEASSLGPQSYPIQVGVIMDDGSTYSAYIKPTPEHWTDWSEQAFSIHNIPRQLLIDVGKTPELVAQELNEFIGKRTVACDGGVYDTHWANALYEVTSCTRSWEITSIYKFQCLLNSGLSWQDYKQFYASSDQLNLTEHDALDDAKLIQHIVKLSRNSHLKPPPR